MSYYDSLIQRHSTPLGPFCRRLRRKIKENKNMNWYWFREEQSIYEMAQPGETSLYVGNLEPSVTDSELYDAVSHAGHVCAVHVCRDLTTRRSLGYGYVTFYYPHEAKRALETLNFTALKGKYMTALRFFHNPSHRKHKVGNVFIKNLEKSIDHRAIRDLFSAFGSILRCKVATKSSGESKGFALVQFNREERAQKAVSKYNEMFFNEQQVYVGSFLQRDTPTEKTMFTDLYVKNLSKSLTDEELNTIFEEFGPTTSCVIIREGEVPQGKSRGFGFVNFEYSEDAEKALEALNGKTFQNKEWFVAKSKKNQRESELKKRLREAIKRSQGLNYLCVKKLHKSVTDEQLRDFFSSHGTIKSCKVMRDSSGVSKGSGLVSFSKLEEACKAMEEVNREMKIGKQGFADLAIALGNATPEDQRNILGENLYTMVEQIEPKFAAKITGMILEMDQNQVLHLLESLHALQSKLAEAMEILRTENQKRKKLRKKVRKSAITNNSKSFISPKALHIKLNTPPDSRESLVVSVSNRSELKDTQVLRQKQYCDNSKDSQVPSFISPKLRSLARANNRTSTHDKSDVLLINRFYSLEESETDE